MIVECTFDPARDIAEVVEGLSVDLEKAIKTGELLNTGTEADYNDIDDPRSIRFRVNDIFQTIDLQRAQAKASKSCSVNVSTPSGESE